MRYIGIIVLFLLLSSCQDNNKIVDYALPENFEVQTLSITVNNEDNLLYSDLYANVKYIHLETTDQSLIGVVNKLEITDDGDFIILDRTRKAVKRFNNCGKYICDIGLHGIGHGEYISPSDVVYDRYTNCIIVLDEALGKLLFYDINGSYLSSIELNCSPEVVSVLNENYLCLYMNHYDNIENKPVGYNFKIINRKGLLVSESLEYDATMETFRPTCNGVFFSMDSKSCIRQPFSSLVYSIKGEPGEVPTITPELYIDFGEKKIPHDWYVGEFSEMTKKLFDSDDILFLISMFKAKNRLFLNIGKGNSIFLYILDLQDRSKDKAVFSMDNDMFGFVSSIFPVKIQGDKCYFITNPSNYESYKENIEKKGEKFYVYYDEDYKKKEYIPSQKDRDLLYSIHDGDNPIIQICTIKE